MGQMQLQTRWECSLVARHKVKARARSSPQMQREFCASGSQTGGASGSGRVLEPKGPRGSGTAAVQTMNSRADEIFRSIAKGVISRVARYQKLLDRTRGLSSGRFRKQQIACRSRESRERPLSWMQWVQLLPRESREHRQMHSRHHSVTLVG